MNRFAFILRILVQSVGGVGASSVVPKIDAHQAGEIGEDAVALSEVFKTLRSMNETERSGEIRDELEKLACQCLEHEDSIVRRLSLAILYDNREVTDSKLEICVKALPKGGVEDTMANFLLDLSELFFLEEKDKSRLVRACLNDGTAALWRGTTIEATRCAGIAAWDGLPGFQQDIETAYWKRFSETDREITSLDKLLRVNEILAGPGTGWDQRNRTVIELSAQSSATFKSLLQDDPGYREIVLGLLELQCKTGIDEMCRALRDSIDRANGARLQEVGKLS